MTSLRILIVAENISMKMGGESSLPFYYARLFQQRGAEVWLACHERVETELREAFPELASRIRVVRDSWSQRTSYELSARLPYRVRDLLVGQVIHYSTQARIRSIAVELAREGKIDVVFEPAPITPKGLSFMYDVGVPVVIGPMCGGMNFPPAFTGLDSFIARKSIDLSRHASHLANFMVRGKLNASLLLVANRATEAALPVGHRARVVRLFESGVDLDMWTPLASQRPPGSASDRYVHFAFSGRFVDLKGVQFLVPAFAKALRSVPEARLHLVGGGDLDGEIRAQIAQEGIADKVVLHGWVTRTQAALVLRDSDVFVMPSLRECGGTAILEAMAMGKPIITTNWGGPADYVDDRCGVLVDPSSPQAFVDGLARAMVRLGQSAELRAQLGRGGIARVRQDYLDWSSKADRVLELLQETVDQARGVARDITASSSTRASRGAVSP